LPFFGLQAYQDGADYVFISPIFQVEGKAPPIGVEKLKEIVNKLPLPVYALGGINKFNVQSVLDTGVYGIASIRYFLD
jgi:thiamine-phosphate pyrophosphorylase